MRNFVALGEHFLSAGDAQLSLDITDEEVQEECGFSHGELEHLHGIMDLDHEILNQGKTDQRWVTI